MECTGPGVRYIEKCLRSKFTIESSWIFALRQSGIDRFSGNNVKPIWYISTCESGVQDALEDQDK